MIFKVVKPSDKYKDLDTYKVLASYCLDQRKVAAGCCAGYGLSLSSVADDMLDLATCHGKLKGTKVRHMILSFDPANESHIDCEQAFEIAKSACQFYHRDYQLFAAVHRDTVHVHIHIVMNTVHIKTGKKYPGSKKDYYAFQQHLRSVIRRYRLKLTTE